MVSNLFTFFTYPRNFFDDFSPDVLNLASLLTLAPSSIDISKTSDTSTNSQILSNESPNLFSSNTLNKSSKELSHLEEKISYSNLTKEEKNAFYLLCGVAFIMPLVWDREDYLRESNIQLRDKDVYGEVKGDAEGPLMKVIESVLGKIRNRGDISDETLDYFLVNDPKFGRFSLLPEIHKNFIMFPADQLYPIQAILLRIFLLFLISI